MENIRCLIADMPQMILADIVQKVTETQPGIEVVDRVNSLNNLPEVIKERAIDVLIYGMDASSITRHLKEIFTSTPELVMIGILEDGKHLCICMNDAGPEDFVNILNLAMKR